MTTCEKTTLLLSNAEKKDKRTTLHLLHMCICDYYCTNYINVYMQQM